ncbi:MAG TPA: AbrB/MazE/SpoVT family DNA-binding domain-containing protein [Nitrospiraceae bacterium]|nr:AbrB/MazE/SpoVT family DNA-binding domain-containing protein [Nitrospiraceae bacterium]
MRTVRQITNIGNSLGVTIPREILVAYGLDRGALVELRPTNQGLLIQPARVVSALSPEGRDLVKGIVRRYKRAFDALSREERSVTRR